MNENEEYLEEVPVPAEVVTPATPEKKKSRQARWGDKNISEGKCRVCGRQIPGETGDWIVLAPMHKALIRLYDLSGKGYCGRKVAIDKLELANKVVIDVTETRFGENPRCRIIERTMCPSHLKRDNERKAIALEKKRLLANAPDQKL